MANAFLLPCLIHMNACSQRERSRAVAEAARQRKLAEQKQQEAEKQVKPKTSTTQLKQLQARVRLSSMRIVAHPVPRQLLLLGPYLLRCPEIDSEQTGGGGGRERKGCDVGERKTAAHTASFCCFAEPRRVAAHSAAEAVKGGAREEAPRTAEQVDRLVCTRH